MFFAKKKSSPLPSEVQEFRKKRPLGWSSLKSSDLAHKSANLADVQLHEVDKSGGLLAAWEDVLVIFPDGVEPLAFEWSDFANARWEGETQQLRLIFVDRQISDIYLQLADAYDETLLRAIRERVDRSVVHQIFRDLPSGGKATGQVRRNADESLFTQVISDDVRTVADREALEVLEAELREAVGL